MPDEVNNVDVVLEQFEGREEEVIAILTSQLESPNSENNSDDDSDVGSESGGSSDAGSESGDSSVGSESGDSASGSSIPTSADTNYYDRILRLMEQVMPDEINNIDVIMEQFHDREEELIETLLNMADTDESGNGEDDTGSGDDSDGDDSDGDESGAV